MIQPGLFDGMTLAESFAAAYGPPAAASTAKAARVAAFDAEGCGKFMLGYLRRHGPTSGEDLTDAAKAHGYRGHDDRCTGSVIAGLSRKKLIRVAGTYRRKRGHGSPGYIWTATTDVVA